MKLLLVLGQEDSNESVETAFPPVNAGVADKILLVKKALSKCCNKANLYKQANDCLSSSNKGLWIAGCELI